MNIKRIKPLKRQVAFMPHLYYDILVLSFVCIFQLILCIPSRYFAKTNPIFSSLELCFFLAVDISSFHFSRLLHCTSIHQVGLFFYSVIPKSLLLPIESTVLTYLSKFTYSITQHVEYTVTP